MSKYVFLQEIPSQPRYHVYHTHVARTSGRRLGYVQRRGRRLWSFRHRRDGTILGEGTTREQAIDAALAIAGRGILRPPGTRHSAQSGGTEARPDGPRT